MRCPFHLFSSSADRVDLDVFLATAVTLRPHQGHADNCSISMVKRGMVSTPPTPGPIRDTTMHLFTNAITITLVGYETAKCQRCCVRNPTYPARHRKEGQGGGNNPVPPRDHSARLFLSVHDRIRAAGGHVAALADTGSGRLMVDSGLVKGVN